MMNVIVALSFQIGTLLVEVIRVSVRRLVLAVRPGGSVQFFSIYSGGNWRDEMN